MKKITWHQALLLFVVFSVVTVVYQLPSGMHALSHSQVCWSSAAFSVIVAWSSGATRACGPPLPLSSHPCLYDQGVPPSCYGSLFCPPRVTVSAISPLSVVPELWLPTACQQHTLCPCHLYPITPAGATCSSALPAPPLLPSMLATVCQEEEGLLLISGCFSTATQLHSDIWEISCHLSLRLGAALVAAKTSKGSVWWVHNVCCPQNTFSSGFPGTVPPTKII